jgi:hypothetical protein
MSKEDAMMKFMSAGGWLPVSLALVLCVAALAQSTSTHDVGNPVALQTLLNQSFEVNAAGTGDSGVQIPYLQKAAVLYACPLNVAGLGCSHIVSR